MEGIEKLKKGSLTDKFKFLFKDSVIYGGASALYKFMALFITPILTRQLSTEEFGVMDGLSVVGSILGVVIILGLDSAIARFFYDEENRAERIKYVSTAFFIQNGASLVLLSVALFGGDFFLEHYLGNLVYAKAYTIIVCSVFFLTNVRLVQNLLKWTFQRKKYLIVTIGPILVYFSTALVLLFYFDQGLYSIFYAQLVSNLIFSVIGILYIKEFIALKIDVKKIMPLLKFGIPLMFVALIPSLIPSLDKYFIIENLGLESLAFYGIGYRVATLIQLPVTGIQTAIGPFFYAMYKEKNANELFNLINVCTCGLYVTVILFILSISVFLFSVLAPAEYFEGIYAVLPLLFSFFLLAMSTSLGFGIDISKKTYLFTIAYFIDLFFTLVSLYFLVPAHGVVGAAYSILIGKFALITVLVFFAYRVYSFRFNLKKIAIIIAIGFASGLLIQGAFSKSWWITLLIGTLLLMLNLWFYWNIILSKQQKTSLKNKILNRIGR